MWNNLKLDIDYTITIKIEHKHNNIFQKHKYTYINNNDKIKLVREKKEWKDGIYEDKQTFITRSSNNNVNIYK